MKAATGADLAQHAVLVLVLGRMTTLSTGMAFFALDLGSHQDFS